MCIIVYPKPAIIVVGLFVLMGAAETRLTMFSPVQFFTLWDSYLYVSVVKSCASYQKKYLVQSCLLCIFDPQSLVCLTSESALYCAQAWYTASPLEQLEEVRFSTGTTYVQ